MAAFAIYRMKSYTYTMYYINTSTMDTAEYKPMGIYIHVHIRLEREVGCIYMC